jgi:hypothetical protein
MDTEVLQGDHRGAECACGKIRDFVGVWFFSDGITNSSSSGVPVRGLISRMI